MGERKTRKPTHLHSVDWYSILLLHCKDKYTQHRILKIRKINMQTIELTPEQQRFIESFSVKVSTKKEETFFYMPFYLKQIDGNKMQVFSFEKLPEDVIEAIKSKRE